MCLYMKVTLPLVIFFSESLSIELTMTGIHNLAQSTKVNDLEKLNTG